MYRRRSFLIGCASVASGPAFAQLDLPVAATFAAPSPAHDSLGAAATSGAADRANLVLRIAGWDTPDGAERAASGEVWVHIDSSWRAAWR